MIDNGLKFPDFQRILTKIDLKEENTKAILQNWKFSVKTLEQLQNKI